MKAIRSEVRFFISPTIRSDHGERTCKVTLETLDKPWASYCTAEGHELLIRMINNYYGQRDTQAWSYGHTYGEDARRYVIKAWSTTDDNRHRAA